MTAIELEISLVEPTFAELGLAQPLLDALHDAGYERPTPIQLWVLPPEMKLCTRLCSGPHQLLERKSSLRSRILSAGRVPRQATLPE